MRRRITSTLLAAAALAASLSVPFGAYAQADRAGVVTPYPAAFFADFSPRTALDMLNRLPAFSIDDGQVEAPAVVRADGMDREGGVVV